MLMESSAERAVRADAAAWEALLATIRRAARSRLALLEGRAGTDQIACPWGRLVVCERSCRCGGLETVTVALLRDHYTQLAAKIARLAKGKSS
jgi:hypothetical protein